MTSSVGDRVSEEPLNYGPALAPALQPPLFEKNEWFQFVSEDPWATANLAKRTLLRVYLSHFDELTHLRSSASPVVLYRSILTANYDHYLGQALGNFGRVSTPSHSYRRHGLSRSFGPYHRQTVDSAFQNALMESVILRFSEAWGTPSASGKSRARRTKALRLLKAWREEDARLADDEWKSLAAALDEDRISSRKLFPRG